MPWHNSSFWSTKGMFAIPTCATVPRQTCERATVAPGDGFRISARAFAIGPASERSRSD